MSFEVKECRSCSAPEWAKRFWSKVEKADGCWLWKGRTNRNGYGVFDMPTRQGKPRLAHRLSSELAAGPIPEGLYVLHHCDTPACVRPDHLYRGVQADNMRDMRQRGRAHRKGAPGERNANALLTAEKVRQIRALYATGRYTQRQIGEQFSVSRAAICSVVRRQSWTHV